MQHKSNTLLNTIFAKYIYNSKYLSLNYDINKLSKTQSALYENK